MFRLHHVHIVACYGGSMKKKSVQMVTELMATSLSNKLHEKGTAFTEAQRREVILHVARGLSYLHGKGVVHRDLKPDNVMQDGFGTWKLIDFGMASSKSSSKKSIKKEGTNQGTQGYMAPELYTEAGGNHKVDAFAFGITIWEMYTNKSPFAGVEDLAIMDMVKAGKRPPLESIKGADDVKVLVGACWHQDPTKRPAMQSMVAAIENSDAEAVAVGNFAAMETQAAGGNAEAAAGGNAEAAAAIQAQMDALEVEKVQAAEAVARQAAENAAVTLKHQIDAIISDAKTTVTHRDDASENDHGMIMSLMYSISDLEDRVLDGDEPDPEGAAKKVVEDVGSMIVQIDFMTEAAVIRISEASRNTCKAVHAAGPPDGIVFNEVRQGQLDTYKQMMISQIEQTGSEEVAKAKAKFAANGEKLEKARTRLMKHIKDSKFKEEEKARIEAEAKAAMEEERAKNEAEYKRKMAEMEAQMMANAAAAAAGGGSAGGVNPAMAAKIKEQAEAKQKAEEDKASAELQDIAKERENIAALEMMGIDVSAQKADLQQKENGAKARIAAAKEAMEKELAAAATSGSALMAQQQAEADAEIKEMEAMRAAHQAKMDAIKRNQEKMASKLQAGMEAEIEEIKESNNPFLNPFAQPDAGSAPAAAGATAFGAAAPATEDVVTKKAKFTRQLIMQKAKQKATEVGEVLDWFGTKSAELFEAEQDYVAAKVGQEARAKKETASGLSAKTRMVVASAKKLHKDYSELVHSIEVKANEGAAGGGPIKDKHKFVKQLDEYERNVKAGIQKEKQMVAVCEAEVNGMQSGNSMFKREISAVESKCRNEGMEASEIEFISQKYKSTNSQNEKRFTDALELLAKANEAMVSYVDPLEKKIKTLMATLLHPEADSPAARQAAIKEGDAKKDEKIKKYKMLIHQMAYSETGDPTFSKANIVKYLEKATGKKEVLLKTILGGIGKHSIHGLLFMASAKIEKPWELHNVYFDLNVRKVTVLTHNTQNPKKVKEASMRTIRAASFFPKTEKRIQADGKLCDYAFCVMLAPPGKPAETWNFSAMNQDEMLIWKYIFDAAAPPDHE